MNRSLPLILIVGAALAFLASTVMYTVREDQQALVLRFGNPVGQIPSEEAGLHFKRPAFLENIVFFDARNLNYDAQPVEVIVANEERLLVDAFVRYRIAEPLRYYQSLAGAAGDPATMRRNFNQRIEAVLNESIRQVLGEVQIKDIITERRGELMAAIQSSVAEEAMKLGVAIIDVRIRQADFPEANAANVYARMSSDYNQQAERIRADGERRAREIRASAEKRATEIRAAAEQEAQMIRGAADAERNAIFAAAYEQDPEFFAFYRSLNAYEKSLRDGKTTIILSPDSEFFRYFNDQNGQN